MEKSIEEIREIFAKANHFNDWGDLVTNVPEAETIPPDELRGYTINSRMYHTIDPKQDEDD